MEARIILDEEGNPLEQNQYYLYEILDGSHNIIQIPKSHVNIEAEDQMWLDDGQLVKLSPHRLDMANSRASENAEWHDPETKLLITLYKDNKILVENRKIKSMKRMWEIIKDEMLHKNYLYSAAQIENKWKSLERSYKNFLVNKRSTGRGRRYCPYERELADILLPRHSIKPICTVSSLSNKENTIPDSEMLLTANISSKIHESSQRYVGLHAEQQSNISVTESLTDASYQSITHGEQQTFDNDDSEVVNNRAVSPEIPRETTTRAVETLKKKTSRSTVNELKELRKQEERKVKLLEEKFQWRKECEERRCVQKQELIEQIKIRNELLKKIIDKE